MEEDERLEPILNHINEQNIGKEYSGSTSVTGKIGANEVDSVSISYFYFSLIYFFLLISLYNF